MFVHSCALSGCGSDLQHACTAAHLMCDSCKKGSNTSTVSAAESHVKTARTVIGNQWWTQTDWGLRD